jgi:polyisoprenoid-binding protein YceI
MSARVSLEPRTFVIDNAHSEAAFEVRHLITKVRGKFSDFEGVIRFDELRPERSTVSFTIQSASIDTGHRERDTHLRSADFFDATEHPTITFKSSRAIPVSESQFQMSGQLTIRGISRDIVIAVAFLGLARDPWGQERIGFEGNLMLNRKDFGLNWNATLETGGLLVGDNVRITLSIQAVAS